IVVVTGAGISCSCGIPDFCFSDGLYALVKAKYPDAVMKGRDLFDAALFRDPTSTALFYTFMAELKSSIDLATPSPTHYFIKTLDTKGKLLRSYTQNIDGLEERAGPACSSSESVKNTEKGKGKLKTKEVRNVQLHGDIHRVRCLMCAANFKCTSEYLEAFREGNPPDCPECKTRSEERIARSARALKVGTLRPSIVLYCERVRHSICRSWTSHSFPRLPLLLLSGRKCRI
ncbi:DHS-like NAD/FAD-binding domain-containing protein, partial [Hysterangium stoloniferum]